MNKQEMIEQIAEVLSNTNEAHGFGLRESEIDLFAVDLYAKGFGKIKVQEYLQKDLKSRIDGLTAVVERLECEKVKHPYNKKIIADYYTQKGFITACNVILCDIDSYNKKQSKIKDDTEAVEQPTTDETETTYYILTSVDYGETFEYYGNDPDIVTADEMKQIINSDLRKSIYDENSKALYTNSGEIVKFVTKEELSKINFEKISNGLFIKFVTKDKLTNVKFEDRT